MSVVVKSPRYLTLMGDDIAKSTFSKITTSRDSIIAGLATAFTTQVADEPIDDALSVLSINIHNIIFNKILLERMALNGFSSGHSLLLEQEKLKNLSIDTTPDPQMALESVKKYGMAIEEARLKYGIYLGVNLAISTGAIIAIPSQTASRLVAGQATNWSRLYQGFSRFNKLASGEWAIVTTPKGQEYKETEIIPDLEKPMVPVPTT